MREAREWRWGSYGDGGCEGEGDDGGEGTERAQSVWCMALPWTPHTAHNPPNAAAPGCAYHTMVAERSWSSPPFLCLGDTPSLSLTLGGWWFHMGILSTQRQD